MPCEKASQQVCARVIRAKKSTVAFLIIHLRDLKGRMRGVSNIQLIYSPNCLPTSHTVPSYGSLSNCYGIMTEYVYRRNKQLQTGADIVMKRVLTIYTGGTVGMVNSPDGTGIDNTCSGSVGRRVERSKRNGGVNSKTCSTDCVAYL